MAENEKESVGETKDSLIYRQIDEAKETPINTIAMENIQEDDKNDTKQHDDIQQNNEVLIQNKPKIETEMKPKLQQKSENDSEIKENTYFIANNTFQMRRGVLAMELNAIKTFSNKELIENDNGAQKKICTIENHLDKIGIEPDINIIEKPANDLLIAETLSTELIKIVKTTNQKKEVEEIKLPQDDIEVPDYTSIVTVRGTNEDVTNSILKAETALDNGEYDTSDSLLIKAGRIFPTKNAKDLVKQVQDGKEPTQNPDPIENASEAVERDNTVKKEIANLEDDSINADKCLTSFEEILTTGNFEKAERMSNIAKTFDPSLDVEDKLSFVKAAMPNKIIEEKQKEEFQKAKIVCQTATECLHKSMKTYDAGDCQNAEQILLETNKLDPILKVELKPKLKTKMETEKETEAEAEETVAKSDKKRGTDLRNTIIKVYYARVISELERNLNNNEESTTSTKEHTETCKDDIRQAEIACQSQELNERTLAKPSYPSEKVDDVLKHVKKQEVENQVKLSDELNCFETEFPRMENVKQKEMEMPIETQRKEEVEKGKSNIRKDNEPEINKLFEDQATSSAKLLLGDTEKGLQKPNTSHHSFSYSSKHNTDFKSPKPYAANSFYVPTRKVKSQNYINVGAKTDISKNMNDYNERMKVYKYTDLTAGNLVEANPNNAAQDQLNDIQVVKASQTSSDQAKILKKFKSDDLKRERQADLLMNLALDFRTRNKFVEAHYYLEQALEKRPNEETRELLADVKRQIDSRNEPCSLSKKNIKFEANRLLNEADNCIQNGDLVKAESYLIISCAMDSSGRTMSVHKKFKKACSVRRDKVQRRDGRND